ncbi:hypothetical protein HKX48_007939 [Thoreauomyces humboldtii]|nr:hypothetical protein HKX48_007939 [Thoreauomyces humboldtii]
MPKVLCFGSVNVDDVFVVPDIVKTGETISSTAYTVHAGGKGANQSVALANAGVEVHHAGRIGKDGVWVSDLMNKHGVRTELLTVDEHKPSGRAIIQVSTASNDNAIVLLPGTNHAISLEDADRALAAFEAGDWIVLQNEINMDAANHVLKGAREKGLVVVVNPAPCPSDFVKRINLEHAHILVLNDSEAASIAGQIHSSSTAATPSSSDSSSPAEASSSLLKSFPSLRMVVVTLGSKGALVTLRPPTGQTGVVSKRFPALSGVNPVDTTGAGDTFVGFLVATLVKGVQEAGPDAWKDSEWVDRALQAGCAAGGMACETEGAMPGIPLWKDVEKRLAGAKA